MPNPRQTTVRAAARTSRELKRLFDKLGNKQHPRGAILTAYRRVHRELRDVYRRDARRWEVVEALEGLRRDVATTATDMLERASTLGAEQAQVEARAWKLTPAPLVTVNADALAAWVGVVEQQAARALATTDPNSRDRAGRT